MNPRCLLALASVLLLACKPASDGDTASNNPPVSPATSNRGMDASTSVTENLPDAAGSLLDAAAAADSSPDAPAIDAPAAADAVAAMPDATDDAFIEVDCGVGFHKCGSNCVNNLSVNTCGSSCDPCPAPKNGSATCDGVKCAVQCPVGTKVCKLACELKSHACGETCGMTPIQGPIACGRACVADTPNSCCSQKLCGGFGCRNNRCLTRCQNNSDCAAGLTCNAATGQCGPCGQLGQFCCWDENSGDYDCLAPGVFCDGDLKCVRP
jgi:hypothetical protein